MNLLLIGKRIGIVVMSLFLMSCSGGVSSVPGYIEGEYTYISSGVSGALVLLGVERGQTVKLGTFLYRLDLQPEKASVEVAKANSVDLQFQVAFAKRQWERQSELYKKQATSKVNLDQAQTDFATKSQQLKVSQSELIHSEWALQQKTQFAPVGGVVFDTFYRLGEQVPMEHPVLAILSPKNIKVLFYIPETSLNKIKLGQTVMFSCDGCKKTAATISYISPEAEYTPPVIYSKDTRYKLVYLIRATLPENVAVQFHPGQPIEVHFHS